MRCTANQCKSQLISACDGAPGYGLNAYQGRGSPEIDMVEVQPGSYTNTYSGEGCPEGTAPPDAATVAAATIKQPFVSSSLQVGPGMPAHALQRPFKGCVPQPINVSGRVTMQWYPELQVVNPAIGNVTAGKVALSKRPPP